MTDLAVIILAGKEELHIGRCLEKLAPLEPRQVFVVESQTGDRTHERALEVAKQLGWQVKVEGQGQGLQSTPTIFTYYHTWPGNQAKQFNWALDNLEIAAKWVLRLDADEYLIPEAIEELKSELPKLPDDVTLISLPLVQVWAGRVIKFGTGTLFLPRIFRLGVGRSDDREMDEKICVTSGREIRFKYGFADDNLISIDAWTQKHLDYAEREARAMIAGSTVGKKSLYSRLPLFWRALAYFCYRYFIRGGFLEGKAGFTWHFLQGLWYRVLVDYKIWILQRHHV